MVETQYELRLLGPFEIEPGGEPPQGLRSRKTEVLLSYLIVEGQAVSRSFLADFLWSDKSETRGRANLSRAIHDITSVLPDSLRTDRQTVQFRPNDLLWVDTTAFTEYVKRGTVRDLERALRLYRGEFLTGLAVDDSIELEAWLMTERERWRLSVSDVLRSLIQKYADRGAFELALSRARHLERLEPWREEAHRQIMHFLALLGRRSEVLRQYETCRQILADELDVEPSEKTRNLYEQIRTDTYTPYTRVRAPATSEPVIAFTGREEEHALLVIQWRRALKGTGKLTLIEGEAGAGKTRLAKEVLQYITRSQIFVLRGRCYRSGIETFGRSILDALRGSFAYLQDEEIAARLHSALKGVYVAELSQFLPEILDVFDDIPDVSSVALSSGQLRLFEAVARYLRALAEIGDGVVLFLDDLHWADGATVDLLTYLYTNLSDRQIWFLGAYQREYLDSDHPLLMMRHAHARENKIFLLELRPLTKNAVQQQIEALVDASTEQTQSLARFLHKKSGGNALILSHYMEYLQGKGLLDATLENPKSSVERLSEVPAPFTVREALQLQVAQLSRQTRQLLDVLAVIGTEFDPHIAREVVGAEVDVHAGIEELLQRRLIVFHSLDSYAFNNGVLWEVIYESIPEWRRQQLHRDVAEAIEKVNRGQSRAETMKQVAYHYARGGEFD